MNILDKYPKRYANKYVIPKCVLHFGERERVKKKVHNFEMSLSRKSSKINDIVLGNLRPPISLDAGLQNSFPNKNEFGSWGQFQAEIFIVYTVWVYFKSHHCSSPWCIRECTSVLLTCYLTDMGHFNTHHWSNECERIKACAHLHGLTCGRDRTPSIEINHDKIYQLILQKTWVKLFAKSAERSKFQIFRKQKKTFKKCVVLRTHCQCKIFISNTKRTSNFPQRK